MTDDASTQWIASEDARAIQAALAEAVLAAPGAGTALDDDPAAYLRLVAATRVAADSSGRMLRDAVAAARAAGHSWDALGGVLGVTRQAAQQRFGTPATPAGGPVDGGAGGPVDGGGPVRKVLAPLTAFDEMAVLAREGRYGWHSVDYGFAHHVVESSPWQWEHCRVSAAPGARRRMEEQGWQRVKLMWFPWAYYTRRLDVPAEPEPRAG